MIFPGDISKMPYLTHGKSRAINAENRTGEKGKGGMAASPCLLYTSDAADDAVSV